MSYYLGVDIGATNLRAAIATESLDIVGRDSDHTGTADQTAFADRVRATVDGACDRAGISRTDIERAGVASVGPFEDGEVVDPPNLPGEETLRPADPLLAFLDPDDIVLHNDAVAGVIGEHFCADAATENMVYLTLSTGVGAGVIVDGTVLSGHRGNAAEVGHLTLDPDGKMACGCGQRGHWEAYCGGANIPRYATALAADQDLDTTLPADPAEFTAKDLFERAGSDDLADHVVDRIAHWNVLGVANVVHAFAPSYVAVGGAITRGNPEAVLEPIRREVPERLMVAAPTISQSAAGSDVVLLGALVSAVHGRPVDGPDP